DGGDDRHGRAGDRAEGAVERGAEVVAVDGVEVRAGAEARAGSGDDDRAGLLLERLLDRAAQRIAVLDVQRVPPLLSLEPEEPHRAGGGDRDHRASSHTAAGESGSRSTSTPSASPTAPASTAAGPSVPPSPTPRAPSGLSAGSERCSITSPGTSTL